MTKVKKLLHFILGLSVSIIVSITVILLWDLPIIEIEARTTNIQKNLEKFVSQLEEGGFDYGNEVP